MNIDQKMGLSKHAIGGYDADDDGYVSVMRIAVHEVGHAVVALLEGFDIEGLRLPDVGDGDSAIRIIPRPRITLTPAGVVDLCRARERRIRICLAGPIAEGQFIGTVIETLAHSNDYRSAIGMMREIGGTTEEEKYIGDTLFRQTLNLLRARRVLIEKLATRLVNEEWLHSKDVTAALRPRP